MSLSAAATAQSQMTPRRFPFGKRLGWPLAARSRPSRSPPERTPDLARMLPPHLWGPRALRRGWRRGQSFKGANEDYPRRIFLQQSQRPALSALLSLRRATGGRSWCRARGGNGEYSHFGFCCALRVRLAGRRARQRAASAASKGTLPARAEREAKLIRNGKAKASSHGRRWRGPGGAARASAE